MATGATVLPARGAPYAVLRAATGALAAELARRGEHLPSAWPDDAARDLALGDLLGVYVPGPDRALGLAFSSRRGRRAFAHVHVEPGPAAGAVADALIARLVVDWPVDIAHADVGLSGLPEPVEASVARAAADRHGGDVLLRDALLRSIGPVDRTAGPADPGIGTLAPLRSVPVAELAALDWRAFAGGPDERLVADTIDEAQETLAGILAGRLGAVLDGPSAVVRSIDGRPIAFIVVADASDGDRVVLDLAVDPGLRRRGLAAFLLQRAVREVGALGGTTLRLWVTRANTAARTLYERSGFRPSRSAAIYRYDRPTPPGPPGPA